MHNKTSKKVEDDYFARAEYDRLKKIADEREAKMKEQEREELKKLHWMRCPKDGCELVEIVHLGIHVDKCTHCGGIFLDSGELDHLFEASKKEDGMLGKILRVFQ